MATPFDQIVARRDITMRFRLVDPNEARKTLPEVPDIRHDDSLTVPSTMGVQAVMAAYNSAQSKKSSDWKGGAQLPAYMYNKKQGSAVIELRPPSREPRDDRQLTDADIEALWALLTGETPNGQAVTRITTLTGDVLLALLAMDNYR